MDETTEKTGEYPKYVVHQILLGVKAYNLQKYNAFIALIMQKCGWGNIKTYKKYCRAKIYSDDWLTDRQQYQISEILGISTKELKNYDPIDKEYWEKWHLHNSK